MNKRIKELAEQAEILMTETKAIHNTPYGEYPLTENQLAKFAELIVRECAERLLNDVKLTDIQTTRCVASIREHFGVEE